MPVQASAEQGLSQVFLAMHWGEEFISGSSAAGQRLAGVNALTTPAYCPDSKQPEFKHAAVKVLKAELPWTLLAMAWLPENQVLTAQAELRALMGEFPFATCVPFGNATAPDSTTGARHGVLLRAAGHEAASDELLQRIEEILHLHGSDLVRYADRKRGQRRAMRLLRSGQDATLQGFLLAGDISAQKWVSDLLVSGQPAQRYGRALLAPGSTPPVDMAPSGKVVCTCFNVTDRAINTCLATCTGSDKQRLASLQDKLHCGTNCGSCVPQLQRMVRQGEAAKPALALAG